MVHANKIMPYHFNPSISMTGQKKVEAYVRVFEELNILLQGETDVVLKMSSINCILRSNLSHYYWVGFYVVKEGRLSVGPYQGTLACLHIDLGQGVCGTVASTEKTKIVHDVHTLIQGKEHISCDQNSKSEIVVPVFDQDRKLFAVFDVDSTEVGSFDTIDQEYLERIMDQFFSQ